MKEEGPVSEIRTGLTSVLKAFRKEAVDSYTNLLGVALQQGNAMAGAAFPSPGFQEGVLDLSSLFRSLFFAVFPLPLQFVHRGGCGFFGVQRAELSAFSTNSTPPMHYTASAPAVVSHARCWY